MSRDGGLAAESTDGLVTGLRTSRRWTVLRWVLAVILLTAAGLKAYQLATTPSLEAEASIGVGPLNARWLNILVVEFELVFSVWLIFGMLPKLTWFASVACFSVFAGVSFYRGVIGADSCGCFGEVKANPWLTFGMDVCMVGLLFTCKPEGRIFRVHVLVSELMSERRFRRVVVMGICWLSVAVPVTVMMTSVSEHSFAELGTEFIGADGRKTILLEPKMWTGKEFPLLPYIEPSRVREQLKTGEWVVVLYHHDCPKCKETISELASEGTPNVVCVEVPPYGEAILPSKAVRARLRSIDSNSAWVAETPTLVLIRSLESKVYDRK